MKALSYPYSRLLIVVFLSVVTPARSQEIQGLWQIIIPGEHSHFYGELTINDTLINYGTTMDQYAWWGEYEIDDGVICADLVRPGDSTWCNGFRLKEDSLYLWDQTVKYEFGFRRFTGNSDSIAYTDLAVFQRKCDLEYEMGLGPFVGTITVNTDPNIEVLDFDFEYDETLVYEYLIIGEWQRDSVHIIREYKDTLPGKHGVWTCTYTSDHVTYYNDSLEGGSQVCDYDMSSDTIRYSCKFMAPYIIEKLDETTLIYALNQKENRTVYYWSRKEDE